MAGWDSFNKAGRFSGSIYLARRYEVAPGRGTATKQSDPTWHPGVNHHDDELF